MYVSLFCSRSFIQNKNCEPRYKKLRISIWKEIDWWNNEHNYKTHFLHLIFFFTIEDKGLSET